MMSAGGNENAKGGVGDTLQTDALIAEIDKSVRIVLARKFPNLPACDREDVRQEVRVRIWKILADGKKIERLDSYLWKVVYTTTLNILGDSFKEVSLDGFLEDRRNYLPRDLTVGSGVDTAERRELIDKLVARLPRKRRLVVKYHLLGKSLEETAGLLSWSLPKVRHLFYRSIEELKKMVAGSALDIAGPQKRKADGRKKPDFSLPEPGSAGEIAPE